MQDYEIVDLYWARSEKAISETKDKYGSYCRKIAMNIVVNVEDSEECVNDTYLSAWNSMPTERPDLLAPFLAAITRNHIGRRQLEFRLDLDLLVFEIRIPEATCTGVFLQTYQRIPGQFVERQHVVL